MSRQKEVFKKMHPEQFSDSIITQKAQLDKDFMDYYLSTVSSRSQEKEFEQFCQKIIEAELCPNLLTQTGPTGGGDSKVDSETYPVSEVLTETWFYGNGNKAGTERWAFAISAKKEWSGKFKSDVEKIVKVNKEEGRGYTKIFFLSNQYISDKKRSQKEDELRNIHNMDIRIFDKNWLLDKVFAKDSNKLIAVNSFNLSENLLGKKIIGKNDYYRQAELKKIEEKLSKPTELKISEIVPLASKSIELGRELELNEHEILGLIDRYKRLTNEYGNKNENIKCIYDCAWTIYWWYTDERKFYELYSDLEKLVLEEESIYGFEKLIILWINLNALKMEGFKIDINQHTKKIVDKYEQLTSDKTKPNTILQAKNTYQLIRVFLGDDINNIVNDYIEIIKKSKRSLAIDLYPISRIIQENKLYENAKRYNELFELVVERMGEENKDGEIGRMLAKRGHSLKDTKPYESISYFSRTLRRFYNEANKDNLILTILEMGELFEKIGLFWSARNFYLYSFCLCFNQYIKQGEISPVLIISANHLKYIELKLGRIMYSAQFHCLEQIFENIYPKKLNNKEESYDYILAIQIFRTSFEKLDSIGKLAGYFNDRNLYFSKVAVEYQLGHYNDEMLTSFNGDKEVFDDFIDKWKNQPVLQELKNEPWYGFEEQINLQSRVLGCLFEVKTTNSPFAIEFASSILATIECFLGTGINIQLMSIVGNIKININLLEEEKFNIDIKHNSEMPTEINITISRYGYDEYLQAQNTMNDKFVEILGIIISIMFPRKEDFNKIKLMVEAEEAVIRTNIFANSTFISMETFGESEFSFRDLTEMYNQLNLIRSKKLEKIEAINSDKADKTNDNFKINYDKPLEGIDFTNISNENVITSDIINVPLWDKSGWMGVMFLMTPSRLPILAPVFSTEIGKNIFSEWIEKFGVEDNEDILGLRIIKGINKENPEWYRVIIGDHKILNIKTIEKKSMVLLPVRLHTMEAQSNINVINFEKLLSISKKYYICPAILKSPGQNPEVDFSKMILKHIDSIKICNAWEVEENDILYESGIMPNDDPVIPKGKEDSDILKIIKRKLENR
ncbi:hypothetical protein CYK62_00845 [Clostridium perfringens]|uniref:hypothetical protein n=1 Tax=Clostridium perfringens TaxID=1502 RepID=UPI000D709CE3|nr:hypothetical protein [Clostridium perfringens]MBO3319844.1 hypothetical protein [Clostridium perfringens]PWX27120.1 hypothetical protein CYK62_00845 [Clostridium perfringens]